MIEQHLKAIAEEFQFPFNHLNKILSVNLTPSFTVQLKEGQLKFLGFLPEISKDKLEQGYLQCMKLNLALESCVSATIGLTADEKLTLSADLFYALDYKMLKESVETFANHLDKISSMLQDSNKEK